MTENKKFPYPLVVFAMHDGKAIVGKGLWEGYCLHCIMGIGPLLSMRMAGTRPMYTVLSIFLKEKIQSRS